MICQHQRTNLACFDLGKTAGEALDALTSQLDEDTSSTLVLVQRLQPDQFFTAEQQMRLEELMTRWRTARDSGHKLPPDEQAELEALVDAQLEGSAKRAEALIRDLQPCAGSDLQLSL
jgi:hypothetical protein